MKRFYSLLVFLLSMLLCTLANAALPPQKKNVHIEIRSDVENRYGITRYQYFFLRDMYLNDETKVISDHSTGITTFDFSIYHPLYDEIIAASNRTIPFYVEPGDTLIINVASNGKPYSYKNKNGKAVKYRNLLFHDFSNHQLYTDADFAKDKAASNFTQFVDIISQRSNSALDSLNRIADQYNFTSEERKLATYNIQLQYAFWVNEYAQNKSCEISAYARHHSEGWQSNPEQDAEMEAIRNPENYAFMRSLPLTDSLCLASRYFPLFLRSYEYSPVLCHDQYMYYGETEADSLLMDSAYIAHELDITSSLSPSLFMEIALENRHIQRPEIIDDGSIQLENVNVYGLNQFYNRFGKSDITPTTYKKNWANREYYKGIITGLVNRKKIRNQKRAEGIIQKLDELEPDIEAIQKAYEETMNEKK